MNAPSLTHAAALLVIHGRVTITTQHNARIRLLAGMGAVFDSDAPYSIESDTGGIVLIVESIELTAHSRGISSPLNSLNDDAKRAHAVQYFAALARVGSAFDLTQITRRATKSRWVPNTAKTSASRKGVPR